MQQRLLIAVVLSVLILVIFQKIGHKEREPYLVRQKAEDSVDKMETQETSFKKEIKESKDMYAIYAEISTATITNGKIEISICSIGSGINALKIKDEKKGLVNLVREKKPPFALGLKFTGEKEWSLVKKTGNELSATISINGIKIERKFKISQRNIIEITNIFKNNTNRSVSLNIEQGWYNGLGTTSDLQKENFMDTRPFAKIEGSVRNNMKNGIFSGKVDWAGVVNRYFLTVFLDIDDIFKDIEIIRDKKGIRGCAAGMGSNKDKKFPTLILKGKVDLSVGENFKFTQKIYGGLKEYTKLKNLDKDLDKILSFGIFSFLSRLFLNVLIWFNSFTKNYGIAIILLTVVLQIFIFPLTVKSYKSMQAMKELQPKMTNIRTKYKDDPQRMNQEMLVLYKKHKVNPFSGCLPLLCQMPIFISLFTMLRGATELRYAPFLWINDLSKADILFSTIPAIKNIPIIGGGGPLPFLMGAAMFLQQKFTGGTEGPQKNLTYIMPIMFTFLFMKFPSGLVLYWLSNSILTFIIQYTISKKRA